MKNLVFDISDGIEMHLEVSAAKVNTNLTGIPMVSTTTLRTDLAAVGSVHNAEMKEEA